MLKNLIEWERKNGYKAVYVAKRLGLTEAQYSKIKNGKQKPPLDMAYRLAVEFKIENPLNLLKDVKEVN